jgi:hypothetical protein
MHDKDTPPQVHEESLPVATFKNSLKQWQARWLAQRATSPAELSAPPRLKIRGKRVRKGARTH